MSPDERRPCIGRNQHNAWQQGALHFYWLCTEYRVRYYRKQDLLNPSYVLTVRPVQEVTMLNQLLTNEPAHSIQFTIHYCFCMCQMNLLQISVFHVKNRLPPPSYDEELYLKRSQQLDGFSCSTDSVLITNLHSGRQNVQVK